MTAWQNKLVFQVHFQWTASFSEYYRVFSPLWTPSIPRRHFRQSATTSVVLHFTTIWTHLFYSCRLWSVTENYRPYSTLNASFNCASGCSSLSPACSALCWVTLPACKFRLKFGAYDIKLRVNRCLIHPFSSPLTQCIKQWTFAKFSIMVRNEI